MIFTLTTLLTPFCLNISETKRIITFKNGTTCAYEPIFWYFIKNSKMSLTTLLHSAVEILKVTYLSSLWWRGQRSNFTQCRRNVRLCSGISIGLVCFFFRMLDQIVTKLGQNDQLVSGYKCYQQFDLKGHIGATGVEKVIFKVIYHRSIKGHLVS